LRETMSGHGLESPRLARRMNLLSDCLQLELYVDDQYLTYSIYPDGRLVDWALAYAPATVSA
jgi:hypothetical protein